MVERLRTVIPKDTLPPGGDTLLGVADLLTTSRGGTSVMVTEASAVSVASLPSSSVAVTVTVSWMTSPALPLTVSRNVQA